MTIEAIAEHCMAKKMVTEELPFDESTLVYKVAGKMFALTNSIQRDAVNLKCDPEVGIELRAQYDSITPGWHMNKTHWITVRLDGPYSDDDIRHWIDNSYDQVVAGMTKKMQRAIAEAE